MERSEPDIEKAVHSSIILNNLLEQVKNDDSSAANKVYNRFAERLIHHAAKHISQVFNAKIDPEDIVQSVFRSFFVRHRVDKIRFESWNDLFSFLLLVTSRKCGEKARMLLAEKRSVNREQVLDPEMSPEQNFGVAGDPTPDQVAIFNETLTTLMEPMSESQRTIVHMRMKNYTYAEIGDKLGRTERTVYRTLGEIRDRMNEILAAAEE